MCSKSILKRLDAVIAGARVIEDYYCRCEIKLATRKGSSIYLPPTPFDAHALILYQNERFAFGWRVRFFPLAPLRSPVTNAVRPKKFTRIGWHRCMRSLRRSTRRTRVFLHVLSRWHVRVRAAVDFCSEWRFNSPPTLRQQKRGTRTSGPQSVHYHNESVRVPRTPPGRAAFGLFRQIDARRAAKGRGRGTERKSRLRSRARVGLVRAYGVGVTTQFTLSRERGERRNEFACVRVGEINEQKYEYVFVS